MMLHFTFIEKEAGFIKWLRTIPKIRCIIRNYSNYTSEQVKMWHREEYLQANKIYRNYLVFRNLCTPEERTILEEITQKKRLCIPKEYKSIYERWLKTVYKKSVFKPVSISDLVVGSAIEKARKEACKSRIETSKLLGISVSSLRLYENGRRKIPFIIYYKLAQIFDISMFNFLK